MLIIIQQSFTILKLWTIFSGCILSESGKGSREKVNCATILIFKGPIILKTNIQIKKSACAHPFG